MKTPAPDAEPLRDEQASPVRATNSLLMTADEPGHFTSGQQSVGQALQVRPRTAGDLIVDPNASDSEHTFLMASSEDPR